MSLFTFKDLHMSFLIKINSFTDIYLLKWKLEILLKKKSKFVHSEFGVWSNEQVIWFFNFYDFTRFFFLLGRSYSHKSQFLVFAQNPVGLSQGVTISASLIIGMKQGGIT